MESIVTAFIAGLALAVSVVATILQSRELKGQKEELKEANKANKISSEALVVQAELQGITTQLQTEIYLHSWNNDQVVLMEEKYNSPEQAAEKKRFAQANYQKIIALQKILADKLNSIEQRIHRTW
jgi:hypothetical protein